MDEAQSPSASRPVRVEQQSREHGRPRTIRKIVKLHEDEERRLLLKAAPRGISLQKLMVESALAGGAEAAASKAELAAELRLVMRFLGKLGTNINQIAKVTNATLEQQPETAAAMAAVGKTCERINRLLDDVGADL